MFSFRDGKERGWKDGLTRPPKLQRKEARKGRCLCQKNVFLEGILITEILRRSIKPIAKGIEWENQTPPTEQKKRYRKDADQVVS